MTLIEIIQRAAQGATLSPEECEALQNFRSDDDLRSELANTVAERDQLHNELNVLTQKNAIAKIAADYQFSDPDYLAFRFSQMGITPDSENATTFMESLKTEQPKFFKLDIAPGVPTPQATSNSAVIGYGSFADELTRRLENAPEIR